MTGFGASSRTALTLGLIVILGGCVTSSQATRLQKDLDDVKRQLFQVQQDTAGSRAQIDDLTRGLGKQDGSSSTQADLNASIQSLLDQIQTLSEKMREMVSRMAALSQEIQGLKEAGRRNGGPSGAAGPVPPSTAFPTESSAAPAPNAADRAFRTAYADYSKGNYELALMGFNEFLRTSPGDPRGAEARYWVGECLYSQGKYKEAIEAFDLVLTAQPEFEKVPAALLKKGYAQIEMGQTSKGVETLGKLMSTHGDTDESRLASERLRQLGLRN